VIPLCVHSTYSPLGGLLTPREICEWAKANALETIALTDTNGLYGMQFFLEAAKEYGISPIIGSEVIWNKRRVVCLCTSTYSYSKLCILLTKVHMEEMSQDTFLQYLNSFLEEGILFSEDKGILSSLPNEGNLFYEVCPGFFTQKDYYWAHSRNIPLIASTRGYYLKETDHFYYQMIRAIDQNSTLSSTHLDYYNKKCRLYSPLELSRMFTPYPMALKNAQNVAKRCQYNWYTKKIIFPLYEGKSEEDCKMILHQKAQQGLLKRYTQKNELFKKSQKRLQYELSVICQKGFSSYFLVVEDIVKNSPRTCGRGSAASSLVSYLLEITHVDPIKHNLFFDRFLNPERVDPPDIDIDFPWDERDSILDYVFEKYKNHVAMVSNHNTLQGRSSIREVAKVYGISEQEINYVLNRFPRVELNQTWKNVVIHAQRIQGFFKTLSVHPGGVVITPNPISHYVPLQLTPKGLPVIQWEKRQAEKAGLVKIDLLGNRSLAVIRDTITAVNKNHNKCYRYQDLDPLEDDKTKKLLILGQTMGVFYIESPASRQLLQRMKTSEFENIVIASSIIRPAANQFSLEFVQRLHGKPFRHLHPLLKPVLDETYGIIVYQEQVTQVAMALANFSSTEGNNLRKVLDKKDEKKKLQDYKYQFYQGAFKKGISQNILDQIWDMILSFSGYSFCKAHSASYALVSYKSCYLKANYPAEFMAAVISNRGGYYSTFAYLDEARRMNIKILPPDVNKGLEDFVGQKDFIRTGLSQVKGLTQKGLQKLLNYRPYQSLEELLERTDISFEDAKVLVKSRCFSTLKDSTYVDQMWRVYAFFAKKRGHISNTHQALLPNMKEYNPKELIDYELDLLGGGVSFPEWALYRDALSIKGRVRAQDLRCFIGKEVVLFGLYVTSKKVRTSSGGPMMFCTFSDETDIFETVFFPGVYLSYQDLLQMESSFLIKGVVEETLGSIQVRVLKIKTVEPLFANRKNQQVV
jgi:error-prone DNA polymerase